MRKIPLTLFSEDLWKHCYGIYQCQWWSNNVLIPMKFSLWERSCYLLSGKTVCVFGCSTKKVWIKTGCKIRQYHLVIKVSCLLQNLSCGRHLFTRACKPECSQLNESKPWTFTLVRNFSWELYDYDYYFGWMDSRLWFRW